MASTVSTLTPLGDSKHGGALFTLPREIRDEIYRLLVKGRYLVYAPLEAEHGGIYTHLDIYDKPDFVILRISKAVSREAHDLLYSESVFQYNVHFYASKTLKPPTQAVGRMKNVGMYISGLTSKRVSSPKYQDTHPTYKPRMTAICEATIDNFTGAQVLRPSVHIRFGDFEPDMIDPLSSYILPKLREFTGFRAILLVVHIAKEYEIRMQTEQSEDMGSNGEITGGFERVRQAMKDAMEPTLGPATASNTCFNTSFNICLEFRPREHVPTILRARAQKLMLDADRLEQGG